MNQSVGKAIPIFILIALGAMFLAADIFGGGGNQLGRVLWWSMLLGAVAGFAAPRAAVPVFLIALFYLDFLKRLLVLGDGLSMEDVMISLGSGPVIIVAVCLYCTLAIFAGLIPFRRANDWMIFGGCVLVSLSGWFTSGDIGILGRGQSMMGTALIGMTCLACYCLYRVNGSDFKVLRAVAIGAVPMALYTCWQAAFGLASWEEQYVRSGLSPTLLNHYVVSVESGVPMRPFSTLNLHPSVGAVSGVLCLVSWGFLRRSVLLRGKVIAGMMWICIGGLYFTSMLLAQNRTTYAIPILYLILLWSLKTPIRAAVMYCAGLLVTAFVISNSKYIYDNINIWSANFQSTWIGERFGTLGTYQDRLIGFMALNEAKNWSPFGLPTSSIPFSHDPVSALLFRFGYVPIGFVLMCCLVVAVWWHRRCWLIADLHDRRQLIRLTAIVGSLVICGLLYGNLLPVAPVNAVLGCLLGLGLARARAGNAGAGELGSVGVTDHSYRPLSHVGVRAPT